MKKLMALLLVLILCVAMACPAFAVESENTDEAGPVFVLSNEEDPEPTPPDDGDKPAGPGGNEEPTPPDSDDNGLGVPETGDQSQGSTALLAGLMGLSLAGIVGVSALLWKNRESNKA